MHVKQNNRWPVFLMQVNAGLAASKEAFQIAWKVGQRMHRHILIATDGSELSCGAVGYAIALAKSVNAKATAITVTPSRGFAIASGWLADTAKQHKERMATLAEEYLNVAREAATVAGIGCELVHLEHDQPYQAIIDTASEKLCDLIVMASHGRRGISAVVLGSETVKVLTYSSIPVLVFRAPRRESFFVPS